MKILTGLLSDHHLKIWVKSNLPHSAMSRLPSQKR